MGGMMWERFTKRIDMSAPLISVIVPVYNVELCIKYCIDSILHQTFTDFELLLIDDGSTDGSSEICDKYCAWDKRCKVVHQANSGAAKARNAGLDKAIGKYVAFVDADDYLHPQYLEILYKCVQNSGCNISVVNFNIVDNDSLGVAGEVEQLFKTKVLTQQDLMFRLFSETLFMVVWGKLYERKLLEEIRFKNVIIAEDVEFNTRVYQLVERIVYADTRLYYWVIRASSVSRSAFSQKDLNAVDTYVFALNNIPKSKSLYRAFALQRLYKVILYTRYNASVVFKELIQSKIETVVNQTFVEFKCNRYIPFIKKCSLLSFYYMPFLYRLFRWGLEKQAKYR